MGVEAAWSAQPTGPAQHPRLLQHKVLPAQGKVLTSCPSFIYIYIFFIGIIAMIFSILF